MIKFTLAQLDFIVGDLEKNAEKILSAVKTAKIKHQTDIIVFPELALSGYPPEDLLCRQDFLNDTQEQLINIQENLPENICMIIGYPESEFEQDKIYNSAAVITRGKRLANYRKQLLPNYGVFDEKRYFTPGKSACVFKYKQYQIGLMICEDLWHQGLAEQAQQAGAEILVSINASPFHSGKPRKRIEKMQERIAETDLPLLYAHHCGAQDDLIFDGSSFALDEKGHLIAKAPFGEEHFLDVSFDGKLHGNDIDISDNYTQIYKALVLGVRDYVRKNNFKKALLGFSGGIDSALTLAIAVDALDKENVLPVIMPSRYTSALSLQVAHQQIQLLDLKYQEISIEPEYNTFISSLHLDSNKANITTQNLQARIRAVMLMAISNQTHALLLNTSNKSELAVGYGTLYGDMCGAYGVIKDLWKTDVYQLSQYRNQISLVIPEGIITRAPSAELAPGQLDTDILPPYDILDEILKQYIEQQKSPKEIINLGFDEKTVKKIIHMIYQNEYKRKQGPLGLRVSTMPFTRERRYPITNKFE
jgi:NAD+ synthetase